MKAESILAVLVWVLSTMTCASWSPRQSTQQVSSMRQLKSVIQPSALSMADIPNDADAAKETPVVLDLISKYGVTCWIIGVSGFIVRNYQDSLPFWPASLLETPSKVMILTHAVSGMLFAGAIITTTLLEWIVVQSKDPSINRFWFRYAPGVEKALVLPGLTGSIVSGIAHAFQNYDSFNEAPLHVQSALYLLAMFGIWWGLTDRATQSKAYDAAMASDEWLDGEVPQVMIYRRVSNVVSCGFLFALYAVMVLKPGLDSYNA